VGLPQPEHRLADLGALGQGLVAQVLDPFLLGVDLDPLLGVPGRLTGQV
jgi:hypothetical protein